MLGMSATSATRRFEGIPGLRSRLITMSAPLAVDCPKCGAPAGHECRTATGHRPLTYHAPRRHLIAQLPSDEARLRRLLQIYEHLAQQAASGSIWSARVAILRTALEDTPEACA